MQMHSMISAHDFELALKLARNEGISANKIQIRPPAAPNQAWIVEEIDRGRPTQVDSVAIDLQQQRVIDHVDFERFPGGQINPMGSRCPHGGVVWCPINCSWCSLHWVYVLRF